MRFNRRHDNSLVQSTIVGWKANTFFVDIPASTSYHTILAQYLLWLCLKKWEGCAQPFLKLASKQSKHNFVVTDNKQLLHCRPNKTSSHWHWYYSNKQTLPVPSMNEHMTSRGNSPFIIAADTQLSARAKLKVYLVPHLSLGPLLTGEVYF